MNVICIHCRQEKQDGYCCGYATSFSLPEEGFDYQKFGDKMTLEIDKWFKYFQEHKGVNSAKSIS